MDIMGLDPGTRGAATLLRRDWNRHGRFEYTFLDMVDLQMLPDGESRKQLDVKHLGDLIERWDPDVAVIENVQVAVIPDRNPGAAKGFRQSAMSPSDAFRFGLVCGMIRAVVMAYDVDVVLVHPRSWKHHFGFSGSDKKPHLKYLREHHPTARPFIPLEKHDGRADSGLLALYHAQKTGMF